MLVLSTSSSAKALFVICFICFSNKHLSIKWFVMGPYFCHYTVYETYYFQDVITLCYYENLVFLPGIFIKGTGNKYCVYYSSMCMHLSDYVDSTQFLTHQIEEKSQLMPNVLRFDFRSIVRCYHCKYPWDSCSCRGEDRDVKHHYNLVSLPLSSLFWCICFRFQCYIALNFLPRIEVDW